MRLRYFLLPHATINVRFSEKQGKGENSRSTLTKWKTTTLYVIEWAECQYKYPITPEVFNLIFVCRLFVHGQLKLSSNTVKHFVLGWVEKMNNVQILVMFHQNNLTFCKID